jgi:hypothetical protein
LCVAFHNISDLVADYFPSVVPLPFADKFALQRVHPTWDLRARHEDKYFELLKTAYLVMTTGDPVTTGLR